MSQLFDKCIDSLAVVVEVLRKAAAGLIVLFFGYMAIAVLVQIAGRYVFDYSIDWTAETATFAQIWMVLLASGLAMKDRLHVSVDALTHLLPVPWLRVLIVVVSMACGWFLWQGIVGSFALIEIGKILASPVLQIPMWIPYLSLPVGLAYFGLELMLAMAEKWRDPYAGRSPT